MAAIVKLSLQELFPKKKFLIQTAANKEWTANNEKFQKFNESLAGIWKQAVGHHNTEMFGPELGPVATSCFDGLKLEAALQAHYVNPVLGQQLHQIEVLKNLMKM